MSQFSPLWPFLNFCFSHHLFCIIVFGNRGTVTHNGLLNICCVNNTDVVYAKRMEGNSSLNWGTFTYPSCSLPDLLNMLCESEPSPGITDRIVSLLYTVVTEPLFIASRHIFCVFLLLCSPSLPVLNQKRLGTAQQWLGRTHAVNHWLHDTLKTLSPLRIWKAIL